MYWYIKVGFMYDTINDDLSGPYLPLFTRKHLYFSLTFPSVWVLNACSWTKYLVFNSNQKDIIEVKIASSHFIVSLIFVTMPLILFSKLCVFTTSSGRILRKFLESFIKFFDRTNAKGQLGTS